MQENKATKMQGVTEENMRTIFLLSLLNTENNKRTKKTEDNWVGSLIAALLRSDAFHRVRVTKQIFQ